MTDLPSKERKPGFQRSETSSAELHIYAQPPDPVLQRRNPDANKEMTFTGRRISDEEPSLIEMSTSKELGAASGSFSAVVKQANPFSKRTDLRDLVSDDAWVDIHFSRHNRRYFVMRGMIDDIRRLDQVAGNGATTSTYSITGRDFGKVWELTPLWFNKYIDSGEPPENVVGSAALKVFSQVGLSGTVSSVVFAYLFGFLDDLAGKGRANWYLPRDMPGVGGHQGFAKNVGWDPTGFSNDPARLAIAPVFLDPDGQNAWAMAQEWSDPTFVELFADLADGDFNTASDRLENTSATPVVFLRDRPFPTTALGLDSPYFSLPEVLLPREDVVLDDLGRSGMERFNAFFVSPQVLTEFMGSAAVEVTAPLWSPDDMKVHGFRRFDVNSRYQLDLAEAGATANDALLTITKEQREKCRDWYCINPYLYNGSVEAARGVLEARVGKRLRIPGTDPAGSSDFTGYIEGVSHNWVFGKGTRSSLNVTRGWIGSDKDYMAALEELVKRYGGNHGDRPVTDFGFA